MTQKKPRLLQSVLTVTVLTLAVKLLAFGREVFMAAAFGASSSADAYNIAFSIIDMVTLVISAYLGTTFIPAYKQAAAEQGGRGATRFGSNVLTLVTVVAILLAALCTVAAPLLVRIFAPSFEADRFDLAISLLRIMVWVLPFAAVGYFFTGILNGQGRFGAQQLAFFPTPICIIAACVFFTQYGIAAIAAAFLLGGMMQPLIQLPMMAKASFRYVPMLDFRNPQLRKTLQLAIPTFIGSAAATVNIIVDKSLASSLPVGSVSALNYAMKLVNLCTGILVVPIATVLFTRMADFAAAGETDKMLSKLQTGIRSLSFLMLPIMAVTIACSRQIVQIVYERGSFDRAATDATRTALLFYMLGLLGIGVTELVARAFYAMQDVKTPMRNAIAAIGVNVVASVILLRFMGLPGLALGTAIAGTVRPILLLRALHRRFPRFRLRTMLLPMAKNFFAAAVSLLGMFAFAHYVKLPVVLLDLIAVASAGMIIYLAVSVLLGIKPRKA